MPEDLPRWLSSVLESMEQGCRRSCWEPAADVYRTRDGWLVKFDLAGVLPEDVQVCISGSRLSVSGVRRDRLIEEGASHYRMEIAYSRFERTIDLPLDISQAAVSTEMHEGMLFVRIQTGVKS